MSISLDDPIVNKFGLYQGNWENAADRNANDFSTEIRYMWDENYLYIYENRHDDDVLFSGTSDAPWRAGDGNLIFLMVGDCGSSINPYGFSHHVFYIVGNDDGSEGGAASVRINNRDDRTQETVQYDSIKVVAKKTGDGWMAEVAVPWTVFQEEVSGFKPAANTVIGMSCVPIDHDDGDSDFAQICWYNQAGEQGIAEGYDYGGWAALKLLEAVVEEAPAVAEAPAVVVAPAAQTADLAVVAIIALGAFAVAKKH